MGHGVVFVAVEARVAGCPGHPGRGREACKRATGDIVCAGLLAMAGVAPLGPANLGHGAVVEPIIDHIVIGKMAVTAFVGSTPHINLVQRSATMTVNVGTTRFGRWRAGCCGSIEVDRLTDKYPGCVRVDVICLVNMVHYVGYRSAVVCDIIVAVVAAEPPRLAMVFWMAIGLAIGAVGIRRPGGSPAGMTAVALSRDRVVPTP
ncbi:hypothetical protein OR1_04177 [Geobacter sp. OR-1]|nr:hypothetical protein OR1_04177 [Geobacter sp. OR-1]